MSACLQNLRRQVGAMTIRPLEGSRFGVAPNGEFLQPDQSVSTCPVLRQKIFPFALPPNHIHDSPIPSHTRGVSRSSRTWGGMRWTLMARRDEARQKRTAKSCGSDISTLISSRPRCSSIVACDGDKKARSPGRARRKPLKPFACGNAGLIRWTCGDLTRVLLFFAREAAGALDTRHSPRPLGRNE
jgi:hypothetical protein